MNIASRLQGAPGGGRRLYRSLLLLGLAIIIVEAVYHYIVGFLSSTDFVLDLFVMVALLLPVAYLLLKEHTDEVSVARCEVGEYRDIIAAAMDGFWISDSEGRLVEVNEAYCRLSGYSREELLRMRIPDLEALEKPEETAEHMSRLVRTGYDRFESKHRRKDGTLFDVEVSANYTASSGGRFFVFLREITERKHVEESLRRSEARLAEAQRIANIGNWDWDITGNHLWWSQEVYRIFGVEAEGFVATYEAFLSFVHPADKAAVVEAVGFALKKHAGYSLEHRIVRPDGTEIYVHERGHVYTDLEGKAVRMVGTVQDITTRRMAEEELRQNHRLFEAIHEVDAMFIAEKSGPELFGQLLNSLLELTGSQYGFVGEVQYDEDAKPYLVLDAVTNISWNDEVAGFYAEKGPQGIRFHNMHNLIGRVITQGEPVVAEDASSDPRRGGLPEGHPKIGPFLGIPFFSGGVVMGMVGLANRPGGYDYSTIQYLRPLISACGNIMVAYRNETNRLKAERAMRRSEQDLVNAQRIAGLGSWYWDVRENRQRWSDQIYHIFGLRPGALRAGYSAFLGYVHPEDRTRVMEAVSSALEERKPYSLEHRIVDEDGVERIVREEGEVVFDEEGKPLRMMGTVQDITERKAAEEEFRKLSMVLEQSTNVVFITDVEGVIEYINPTFESVTGYTKDEALGNKPSILSSGDTSRHHYRSLWETILAGKTWRGTLKNRRKNGDFYWASGLITPVKNEAGKVVNFISIHEDITERVLAEERLRYLADHDKVTGLISRDRFVELLDSVLVSDTEQQNGALMLVDIDGFRLINDRYGHQAGDQFLMAVATLLKTSLMEDECFGGGLFARPGEDEFAVFVHPCGAETAMAMAERMRKAMEAYRQPESGIRATVSVGVVLVPEHGNNTHDLMARADAAIVRSKELGRNRVHLYSPEDRYIENMETHLQQKDRVIQALEDDLFQVWFQPILDIRANQVHHYEALARIGTLEGEVLLPSVFINTAEKFGLIAGIDRVIMLKTFATQVAMKAQGRDLSFAVNLSGKSLGDEGLLGYIRKGISETGADPKRLVFEITETAAIRDLGKATKFVSALKALGCSFSLDDFGVGFTSFIYLRELMVDYIKIDGSFIRRLHEHPEDQVIVRGIADMARSMGIKSIAEFVETQETLDLLKKMKVDYAQGYLISPPRNRIH